MPPRPKVWQELAAEWKFDQLDRVTSETSLEGLNERIQLVLDRKHRGRTIVRLPD